MAVKATLSHDNGALALDLYPHESRERVADNPPGLPEFAPGSMTWFYWDSAKIQNGEWDFLGIEILNIAEFTDDDLTALDTLNLPRVDCPDAGLWDMTVSDVLRWTKRTFGGRDHAPRAAA